MPRFQALAQVCEAPAALFEGTGLHRVEGQLDEYLTA